MSLKKAVRAIIIRDNKMLAMKRDKFGLQYYTLVGGGIDVGEEPEAALRRELLEETGMTVGSMRLVYIEDAGELYGEQYIYFCEDLGGEPALAPTSEESLISAGGKNLYQPMWLPVEQLAQVAFRSSSVRDAILEALQQGFPDNPQTLAWRD